MDEERDKKKDYWTDETEKAVRDFLTIDTVHLEERLNKLIKVKQKKGWNEVQIQEDGNIAELKSKILFAEDPKVIQQKKEIFESNIKKPLNRLVESIIFNYKLFRYDIDLKTLHNDCMGFLFTKFHKFDPKKEKKSFSYFGTIAKRYLQNRKKQVDALKSINLSYDTHSSDREAFEDMDLSVGASTKNYVEEHAEDGSITVSIDLKDEDDYLQERDMFDFFTFIMKELDKETSRKNVSKNEKKVINAILEIFSNHDMVQHYHKSELYRDIKDITRLQTRDITYALSRLRVLYRVKRKEYHKTNFTEQEED
jgi:hypothetical protein